MSRVERLREVLNKFKRKDPSESVILKKKPVYLNIVAYPPSVAMDDHPELTQERREIYDNLLRDPSFPKEWLR